MTVSRDAVATDAQHASHVRRAQRVFGASIASIALAETVLWTRAIQWFPQLPERFPIHFDISGAPDRWSDRGAGWFLLPALSIAILAFFALIAWSLGPMCRGAPGLVNVPRKDLFLRLSPAGRESVLAPTRAFLAWVVSLVAWLFAFILEGTALVAVGRATTLPVWPVFVFLVLVFVTLIPFYRATSRAVLAAAECEGIIAAKREGRR
ncbi:MAG: DUF1648 domain-containing protein [bacterium]